MFEPPIDPKEVGALAWMNFCLFSKDHMADVCIVLYKINGLTGMIEYVIDNIWTRLCISFLL